jgi:hypothetical protein
MSSADNIERAIAELNLATKVETDRRILDDASAALSKGVDKQRPTGIWQIILRNRFAVPTAIAATILLALALFVNMQIGKTVKIERIYGALNKVENIHISEFQAGRTSPNQQVWSSETLGIKLFRTEIGNQAQYTLWDSKNKVRMIKFLSSNSIQTEPITEQILDELEKATFDSNDMVPFSDRNNIPKEAQWICLNDREVSAAVPGTKAYDLNWITKSTNSQTVFHRKWRVFADSRTGLPKRIEWYSKAGTEDDYEFEKFAVVAYPGEDEIEKKVQDVFGRRDGPGFIGTPEAYR